MAFNRLFSFAIPALLFFAVQTHAQGYLEYCVGAKCLDGSGTYTGPIGTYGTGGGEGQDNNLNQLNEDAYRYGQTQALQNYQHDLEVKITDYQTKQQNATNDITAINKIEAAVHQELLTDYPTPPPQMPDETQRRVINPLPDGLTEQQLQSKLDPVWNEVKKTDIVGIAKELEKLNQKMIPISGTDQAEIPADVGQSMNLELVMSNLTNGSGLLIAPYSTTPDVDLKSSSTTYAGAEIRAGMNKMIATESIMGIQCAAGAGSVTDCGSMRTFVAGIQGAYQALDQMVADQGDFETDETIALRDALQDVSKFSVGLAKGVYDGSVAFVDGIHALLDDPGAAADALANALVNYDKTGAAIKQILKDKYQEFVNGDAERRGQILGEASVQVASLFIPGADIAKVLEASVFLKTGVYLAMADSLTVAAELTPTFIRATVIGGDLAWDANQVAEFESWAEPFLNGPAANQFTLQFEKLAKNTERLNFFRDTIAALPNASAAAKYYLAGVMVYEKTVFPVTGVTEELASTIVKSYDELQGKIATMPENLVKTQDFDVTRALAKTYEKDGVLMENTADKVMDVHGGGLELNHRASGPGSDGLYGAIGNDAEKTALAEVKGTENPENFFVGTKTFPELRTLDLTDPAVTQHLGLDPNGLFDKVGPNGLEYIPTQIIGDLAKKNGFDAVILKSAEHPGGKTIFIYKPRP